MICDIHAQQNDKAQYCVQCDLYERLNAHQSAVAVMKERIAELESEESRLVHRVERLRGLCKTASGWLLDAGQPQRASKVLELVGDLEAKSLADFRARAAEDKRDAAMREGEGK